MKQGTVVRLPNGDIGRVAECRGSYATVYIQSSPDRPSGGTETWHTADLKPTEATD